MDQRHKAKFGIPLWRKVTLESFHIATQPPSISLLRIQNQVGTNCTTCNWLLAGQKTLFYSALTDASVMQNSPTLGQISHPEMVNSVALGCIWLRQLHHMRGKQQGTAGSSQCCAPFESHGRKDFFSDQGPFLFTAGHGQWSDVM